MGLANIYLEKLSALEKRYEELTSRLTLPETLADPSLYAKLTKELASLGSKEFL